MNQPQQKTKKSGTSIFIQVAIVLMGIIGGYMYYSQIIKPAKVPVELPNIPREDNLSKFKDFKTLDFSIFNNEKFRLLKTLGDVPVKPGTTGRTDLFAPF